MRAIELNGEAVEMNLEAFRWGRRAAADPAAIASIVASLHPGDAAPDKAQTLDELLARRVAFLTDYQSAGYARRYLRAIQRVRGAEQTKAPGGDELATAAARALFKLMAVKDEYEVARLYSDGVFARQVAAAFDGDLRFEFHLALPLLGRKNAKGEPVKRSFGPWMMSVFKQLARLKFLRATPLDVFSYAKERRIERKLLSDYQILLDEISERLTPENHALAVALAAIPEKIRGFGHVKLRNLEEAKAEERHLIEQFRADARTMKLAAE